MTTEVSVYLTLRGQFFYNPTSSKPDVTASGLQNFVPQTIFTFPNQSFILHLCRTIPFGESKVTHYISLLDVLQLAVFLRVSRFLKLYKVMRLRWLCLLEVLFLCQWRTTDAQCVQGHVRGFKTCVCETTSPISISCCRDGKRLNELPYNFPRNVTWLHLSTCGIKSLPDGWCSNCSLLRYIDLRNNRLKQVKTGSFAQLGQLRELKLSGNDILVVENGSFATLQNLRKLELANNPNLNVSVISNSTTGLPRKVSLDLNFDNINSFANNDRFRHSLQPYDVLGIEKLKIKQMELANVSIANFQSSVATMLKSVQCLDLEGNEINLTSMESVRAFIYKLKPLGKLVALNLNGQSTNRSLLSSSTNFKTCCKSAIEYRNHGRCVISNSMNNVTELQGFTTFYLPPRLTSLSLAYNFGTFTLGHFSFSANRLAHLSMENCGRLILNGPLVGLSCLRNFTLTNTSVTIVDARAFTSLEALETLQLSGCSVKLVRNTSFLQAVKRLRSLDLSRNSLSATSFAHVYKEAPKLEILRLDQNVFTSLPKIESGSLRFVNFSSNRISYFTAVDQTYLKELLQLTNQTVTFDFSSNPFQCTCHDRDLESIEWMQQQKQNIFVGFNLYTCKTGEPYNDILIHTISVIHLRFRCKYFTYIAIAAIGTASLLFLIVGLVLGLKCRWRLAYWFYRVRYRCRGSNKQRYRRLSDEDERTDLIRRVYVVFSETSEQDRTFAIETVGPLLKSLNLLPLFHGVYSPDGFFNPGSSMHIAIIEALDRCVCTVALVSTAFVEDRQMQFATQIALHEGIERLIPVVQSMSVLMDEENKNSFVKLLRHCSFRRGIEWRDWKSSEAAAYKSLKRSLQKACN